MLHEILLSLSGHPSPLLRTDRAEPHAHPAISPAEQELLASLAHLSDLHVKLQSFTAQIGASHPSTICRAVATAISSVHLAAFRRKVLEVENAILRKDAGLVGAYNIVPLTAVVGEFAGWTRRLEWLWEIVQFMLRKEPRADGTEKACTGARIMDRLRKELQTGYTDIEETALSLIRVAQTAWLKQVSAWILYGRLPGFGTDDFFVQRSEDPEEEYVCVSELLPSFVTPSTASSMLFIGTSLNHIRAKSRFDSGVRGIDHLSSQLQELSRLTYPLHSASFSRTITQIRLFLSKNTLQKLLPLDKVLEMLQLLRDFFLLGRGEFAMALTQQADEKIRSRWRRADNLAYEKRDGLANVVVKEGEVAAVLARTWAALGSMQGQHADEDEGLELARGLLRLRLSKSKLGTPGPGRDGPSAIAPTPFRNLLFSVPVILTLQIPSPLDLFLTPSDLQTYISINSYLLSIRRAHIRLTDLWKITPLRRHHPPPPSPPYGSTKAGREKVQMLRERQTARSLAMRSVWTTCSAAIFFLAETEGYLQTEVVAGLWEGFQRWLTTGSDEQLRQEQPKPTKPSSQDHRESSQPDAEGDDEDIWLATAGTAKLELASRQHSAASSSHQPPDPQTLASAHRLYLSTLARRILLTRPVFTDPLYDLLVHIDHLVALVHRLHGIWLSADLEADAGVVDAFVDLGCEERDVRAEIAGVEARVRDGVERVVAALRLAEADHEGLDGEEVAGEGGGAGEDGEGGLGLREEGAYVPRRVGGVDRLLMKLDFGSWFGSGRRAGGDDSYDRDGF
ncbi:Spindle pole body component [Pleurostoma richardsiae]|uniref:Spindle pole body component n=1 Tax=Pleurostoma richardsiae TaxID=41990 RepID=A0AA38VMH0_9PEZI|nr:Spindle pole body component [Pleurostoma richardsiae]